MGKIETPIGSLKFIKEGGYVKTCKWVEGGNKSDSGNNEDRTEDRMIGEVEEGMEVEMIREYFEGKRKIFDTPLRLEGTPFQKRVWEEIRKIPYGETVSYKELAKRCGSPKGYRAVARACGANPCCIIIPCHRIVGSRGELGGYTGGVEKKKFLLNLEHLQKN